jgi:hypothetical protein
MCRENSNFIKLLTRIRGTLREDRYTVLITFRSVLSGMKNTSDQIVEKINTQFFLSNNVLSKNGSVYEIMWRNNGELGRPQTTIWRMRIACWIPKATNTHSEYVMIIAFRLQQWLNGCASKLRCAYSACFFKVKRREIY